MWQTMGAIVMKSIAMGNLSIRATHSAQGLMCSLYWMEEGGLLAATSANIQSTRTGM